MMEPLDLEAIEKRAAKAKVDDLKHVESWWRLTYAADVPALIARVRAASGRENRLQEAVAFLLSVVASGERLLSDEVQGMRSLIAESRNAALAASPAGASNLDHELKSPGHTF